MKNRLIQPMFLEHDVMAIAMIEDLLAQQDEARKEIRDSIINQLKDNEARAFYKAIAAYNDKAAAHLAELEKLNPYSLEKENAIKRKYDRRLKALDKKIQSLLKKLKPNDIHAYLIYYYIFIFAKYELKISEFNRDRLLFSD